MTILFVAIVMFALVYVPIGGYIAGLFGETGNALWIAAWPVVFAWLISVVWADIPTAIYEATREGLEKLRAPVVADIGEEFDYDDDCEDIYAG